MSDKKVVTLQSQVLDNIKLFGNLYSATQQLSNSATQQLSNSATQQLSNSATQQLSNSATQQLSNSSRSFALRLRNQKIFFYILITWGLSACSLDAAIYSDQPPSLELGQERKVPDFIYGEVVTTYGGKPGYEVKAVFGEISEKSKSLNGNNWQLEGVFYE